MSEKSRAARPAAAATAVMVAAVALASAPAWAADAPARPPAAKKAAPARALQAPTEQSMLARLKEMYPSTTFTSVTRTPVPGVFEVVMGPNVAYVGADARHFLFGHLFDMRDQVDITAQRLESPALAAAARAQAGDAAAAPSKLAKLDELPLQDAIVKVNGTGARKIAVFTDPRCPYCHQLEADLPQLSDTTIYTFLLPILGPASREAAEQQWALAMPERALDAAVLDRNIALARRLGVQATPTLVRNDGAINAGAMSLPELTAWLDAGAKVAAAAPVAQP